MAVDGGGSSMGGAPRRDGERVGQVVRNEGSLWSWDGTAWDFLRKTKPADVDKYPHASKALDGEDGDEGSVGQNPDVPGGSGGDGGGTDGEDPAGGGGGGGNQGGGDENLTAEEIREATLETYPSLAIYLNHPELGPILEKAAEEGWSRARLESAIKVTKWWRGHSDRERQIKHIRETNPGQYRALVTQKKADIELILREEGQAMGKKQWSNDRMRRLAQLALQFGWSDNQLRFAIESHKQYDERSDSEKQYFSERYYKHETWLDKLRESRRSVKDAAAAIGVELNQNELANLTHQLYRDGLTQEQLRAKLISRLNLGGKPEGRAGEVGDAAREVKQWAKAYHIPISDQALNVWTMRILRGDESVDSFKAHVTKLAKGQYNGLEDALDRGLTVDDFVDPYRQRLAQLYDMSPDEIDFDQARWRKVLTGGQDKDGKPRVMTLAEAEEYGRSLNEWQHTKAAHQEYADFGAELAKMWGFEG